LQGLTSHPHCHLVSELDPSTTSCPTYPLPPSVPARGGRGAESRQGGDVVVQGLAADYPLSTTFRREGGSP
jgi:hypothetical protein